MVSLIYLEIKEKGQFESKIKIFLREQQSLFQMHIVANYTKVLPSRKLPRTFWVVQWFKTLCF